MHQRYVIWLAACLGIASYGCESSSESGSSAAALRGGQGNADVNQIVDEGGAGEGPVEDGDEGFPEDLECTRGGATSELRVEFDCDEIIVYTCKDLSNLVIEYADGTHEKFDGQSGSVNSFAGNGQVIVGVWVKAGANFSGDGPGYGERVDNPDTDCDPGDNDDDDPPGDDEACGGLDVDCGGEPPPGDDDTENPPGDDDTENPPGDDDTENPPGDDDTENPPGDDDSECGLDEDCGDSEPPSDGDPIDCDETPTDPYCVVD
jgi:hypothetical protein